jgi:capsular polysaccharide biosynthesis protein
MGNRLDLRESLEIARRHLAVVWIAAALGILGGATYAALSTAAHESTALVVLPSTMSATAAEVVVASSNPVLQGSLSKLHPAVSVQTLRSRVSVASLTTDAISITAQGGNDAEAEATANAVANSYVEYIDSGSAVDRIPAQVLVAASSATAPRPLLRVLAAGALGLLLGTAIGVIGALAMGRKDRRLRRRDDMADSIGVPVLASVSMVRPAGAAGWTWLLESYEPSAADAWRLRSVLTELKLNDPARGERLAGCSLTVLSLASDERALALGPQLAAYAATLGVPTVLVIGPRQDTDAARALRVAAATPPPRMRSGRLRLVGSDSGSNSASQQDGVLTVVTAVMNDGVPQVAIPRTDTTVLAVSAGAVAAAQLARVAASTAAGGGRVAGILVGDPDPDDPTTGRLPQLARPNRSRMPSRLTAKQP